MLAAHGIGPRTAGLQRGVTLVELTVGVAIMAISLAIAIPSYGKWVQNTQVRTAAESIQNGLQLARAEAVRRNTPIVFKLSSETGAASWTIGCASTNASCPEVIESRPASEGSENARVGASTESIPSPVPTDHYRVALAAGVGMPAKVTFDSLGQVVAAMPTESATRIDVINAVQADARRLVVTITPGGRIRMCDPALALSTNLAGCS